MLEAAELNVAQAQRALEMTQANYQHGAATTLDVIDAQAALTLAESNRSRPSTTTRTRAPRCAT